MNATTEIVSTEQLAEEIQRTIDDHKDLVVKDNPGFIAAQEAMKVVKGRIKFVESWFAEPIKKAHEAHKALTRKRSESLAPLTDVYSSITSECSRYQVEQERIARVIQRKEEDRIRKEEEERRLAEATELEKQGKADEAEEVISEPVIIAPPPRQDPPKVDGVTYVTKWNFDIENSGKIPREFMQPDTVKIGAYVRAMKENANIPGVKIWSTKTQRVG